VDQIMGISNSVWNRASPESSDNDHKIPCSSSTKRS